MIEEIERLTGDMSLKPEGNLTQFYRQRIQVHPVNTIADDISNRNAEGNR